MKGGVNKGIRKTIQDAPHLFFAYNNGIAIETSIPVEYRRTGTDISDEEIPSYIEKAHESIHPQNWESWRMEQKKF
jgi:hypothetical protein